MSEKQHQGSCHCGAVKYTVELDLDKPVIVCNCSMCGRSGTMLAFVPRSSFNLVQGEGNLASYKFNKNVIEHVFCKTCGIKPFAYGIGQDGKPMTAINCRCLEGVDVSTLQLHAYDGKNV